MAVDAVVHLDQMRCVVQHDGGGPSEPYAWTAIVTGDVGSLTTGVVEASAPNIANGARVLIKPGMRAGNRVAMPPAQRQFVHRFDDGVVGGFIAIVVALLEKDELPGRAVNAGYRTFRTEVGTELGAFLRTHHRPPTDAEKDDLGGKVKKKVVSSVKDALTFGESVAVLTGFRDKDDPIGFDAAFIQVGKVGARDPFTLTFQTTVRYPRYIPQGSGMDPKIELGPEVVTQHYELTGSFEMFAPGTVPAVPPPTTRPPRVPTRPPGTEEP